MTADSTKAPRRIRDLLAGQHLLITGSTGFLAKAFVEKLLRSVDTIAGIHLLVRPRSGRISPRQRLDRDVLGSHAYDRLRATLGDGFETLCDEKIRVVPGDLTKEHFGLDDQAYHDLTKQITLVVNSAATVTFDERVDLAIDLNSLGPARLLRFAKDCGNVPFMHVSTCYVCGARRGEIVEDFSAPEKARTSLPRCAESGEYNFEKLIDSIRAEADDLCNRLGADTEECRRQLIDAGMNHARAHGWNDTYTFTKWIGEQLLIRDHGDVPLVIFRPAIIEGSFDEPLPGWIDGLRMADPLIVAYGQGKLSEFPGRPEVALDLIPVDFVANAMAVTLPVGRESGSLSVYHCASSGRHPLHLGTLATSIRRAFLNRPMNDDNGQPVHPSDLRLSEKDVFLARWLLRQRRIAWLRSVFERFHMLRKQTRKLAALSRQIEQLVYFTKIYTPYTHLDCRFLDDSLTALAETLHPDDQAEFPFDVKKVDWEDYIINRHVPGLRSFVLGTSGEPSARIAALEELGGPGPGDRTESLKGVTIFEAFQRAATRFPDKPVFQIRRNGRWLRYTYDEALRATGTIMRRFKERGIKPGDRVAICAESGPEWGLTYLAAMRAGLTAVPLDPQLPPAEAWSAARFADTKLMFAGTTTLAGLEQERGDDDADVVAMARPFIPPPAASRDPAPDAVVLADSAVASILFTSGTTVAPKAVQLTHRNFLANATALFQVHEVYPADQFLSLLPMYHAFEFTGGFLVPVVCGATITYVEQLKGAEIRAVMQATGTTVMLGVPRLLRMFCDGIMTQVAAGGVFKRAMFRLLGIASTLAGGWSGRQLFRAVHKQFGGQLRLIVSGGSRFAPELFDAFKRMGFRICEGYGLTETSPVLTVNPAQDSRAGSVGPPLPNIDLKIRNQNLEGIGEVWVRGPSITPGYLHNPEATKEILSGGWLRTGDMGRVDSDGYLYLTGRSTDLIVTGAGKNVYPDEVEERYRELPHVAELCVFGMPSDRELGDTVHAVVVIDRESAPGVDRSSMEREIRLAAESISESVPPHQRIAVLHFWEQELPKTSTLKARRGVIRELVRAEAVTVCEDEAAASVASLREQGGEQCPGEDTPAFAVICEIVRAHTSQAMDAVRPQMHLLLDLGIDSIGKIDLLGEIEARFRMRIDDDKAVNIARVSDLLRVVGAREPSAGRPRERSSWQKRLADDGADSVLNGKLPIPFKPLRWFVRGGAGVFMNTYVRVRARGRENILQTGPFILAPNHSSHLDTPSALTALGGKRRVWVAGAEDYFFNTGLKRFVFGKILDTIAFNRKAGGVRGLRNCGRALSRGDGLLIYPEGTRSIGGDIQPFKIGVAVLAIERNVPIIPVHIHRTFNLLRKGQRFIRPGSVTVTFGAPIYPPADVEPSEHYAAFRTLAEEVEHAVVALRDEAAV
ncbi:MAG: AMP-binding protein [Phycisphaerales bacterium]|nr:MAG: AMP-binding protein [Phycisphaerales bacterium]